MKRHARQRASSHPPNAQRQGRAHGGLPLLAARLVQRGQPLLGCRLCLSTRLGARLVHLARGHRSASRARPFMERQACVQLSSTTPCPMLSHAEHVQPSRPQSIAHTLCIHSPPNQARALQPTAARAQQAARLLGELRALTRQRRGEALLGCRLHLIERLGACEQHLGTQPRSAKACTS